MIDVSFKVHPCGSNLFCLVKIGGSRYVKHVTISKIKITIDENGTEVAYMALQPGYVCEYLCYHDELYETEDAVFDALDQHLIQQEKRLYTNG